MLRVVARGLTFVVRAGVSRIPAVVSAPVTRTVTENRPITTLAQRIITSHPVVTTTPSFLKVATPTVTSFLKVATPTVTQTHGYKVRTALHKRCNQCFFVRRQGRLFVECKAKPRHKQMQKMSKRKLFRED